MSDDGRDRYELPRQLRSMAEASFGQGAMALRHSSPAAYAGANVQASLDYAQALLHAREVMRPQHEFVRAQMRSLAEQGAEIGRLIG